MATAAEICVDLLKRAGIPYREGLTPPELDQFESDFDFTFDPEHRELLGLATPQVEGWFDWRAKNTAEIRSYLDWPLEGVLYDVENNHFWPRSWKKRPVSAADARQIAITQVGMAPKLIPLIKHQFMAAGLGKPGAPVFSVYQTEVEYVGRNLPDFFARQLKLPKAFTANRSVQVPFWSSLADDDRKFVAPWPKEGRLFWNRSIDGTPLLPPGVVYHTHRGG